MDDLDADALNEFGTDWEEGLFNRTESNDRDIFSEITLTNVVAEDEPSNEHLEYLHKYFGHKKFRPMQWKIINSIINDKTDNFAVMTTGYGKSLCYQFPAVYFGGITLVISPLISLMEDQVLSLTVSNIKACLLGTANKKQKETIKDIFDDKYALVYLTPEFATGDYGKEILIRMKNELSVQLIAIDEAHCVSSWGHDFRTQYRQLGMLKDIFPEVPLLAVTATATPKVKQDVIKLLKLNSPQITFSSLDRPNLYFSVFLKSKYGVFQDIRKYAMEKIGDSWKLTGPTIIYCITRKETEEMSRQLNGHGLNCLPYHAGQSASLRSDTHEKFVKDKINCVVATIAFGMGIDKPDVRNVIHYGTSSSIDSYYQEVGRAGRDGLPAKCFCFYSMADFNIHGILREKSYGGSKAKDKKEEMSKKMLDYLTIRTCRRQFILSYFEGKDVTVPYRTYCCDNCTSIKMGSDCDKYEGLNDNGLYDFTKDAQVFLAAVNSMEGKFGITTYILFLRGSQSEKIYTKYRNSPLHGSGKYHTEAWWKGIAILLEKEGHLFKRFQRNRTFSYATHEVSVKGQQFLIDTNKNPNIKLLCVPPPEIFKLLKAKTNSKEAPWLGNDSKLSQNIVNVSQTKDVEKERARELTMELYKLLVDKRTQLANENDCMPYMIALNTTLMEMAKLKPTNIEELINCQLPCFPEARAHKFGNKFTELISLHCPNQEKENLLSENSYLIKKLTEKSEGTTTEERTIQSILQKNPLEGHKFGASAQVSYKMFSEGNTLKEIADKRGSKVETILSHLMEAMKDGHKIKLIDLEITDETRNTVMKAINTVGYKNLTKIKNICHPDISYSEIKAVVTYVEIRDHLKKINLPYTEFEDYFFEDEISKKSIEQQNIPSTSAEKDETSSEINLSQDDLNDILKAAAEIDDDFEFDSDETIILSDSELSVKKRKFNEPTDSKKNKKLPPWMKMKKV